MSTAKTRRAKKRQLGQFMTPIALARRVLDGIEFSKTDRVLEPSMGDGSFVLALIEKFMPLYAGSVAERLTQILRRNVFGVEVDEGLYRRCLSRIRAAWEHMPGEHNLVRHDFFLTHFTDLGWRGGLQCPGNAPEVRFDYILGNPPFGGTMDPAFQEELDRLYGFRNGEKIKKETYSFFIVKSLDMLADGGSLLLICSDTFLTIKTMRGLRRLLMGEGDISITDLDGFSTETSQPIVVLSFKKSGFSEGIHVNGQYVSRKTIELTGNCSWRITDDLAQYFRGPVLGDFMVASSGMTIGKNEYFVRPVHDGGIVEPYDFKFFQEPVTLEGELGKARLGRLSRRRMEEVKSLEASGATMRSVRIVRREAPIRITLPHPDYCNYNKAVGKIVYSPSTHVAYWKDDGDALLTFKKCGNWYLHGVGGQPYFMRKGLTWQLIAQRLNVRYLPEGYILDSGAPCAFLRERVKQEELFFILGWALTPLCTHLLKEVINHTRNIQSKDFERLPYPFWVPPDVKRRVIHVVTCMVDKAVRGREFTRHCPEVRQLDQWFRFADEADALVHRSPRQLALFAGS